MRFKFSAATEYFCNEHLVVGKLRWVDFIRMTLLSGVLSQQCANDVRRVVVDFPTGEYVTSHLTRAFQVTFHRIEDMTRQEADQVLVTAAAAAAHVI